MRVVNRLNASLHELMAEDDRIVVLGEDILDPYGGAFKVTEGLSTAFPDRVFTTPISEAAIVGVATGMAMDGYRPIVEIMFGDFLSLTMDQLLNHLSKLSWMYNGQVETPVIVRVPMGGRRGYGPTHSQSIEKHFCGIPGLNVMAVHQFEDPGTTLRRAYELNAPCLLIENKVLYGRPLSDLYQLETDTKPDLTIVAYGGSVEIADQAARTLLADDEVLADVIAVEYLSPFPASMVVEAAKRSGNLLSVEEGSVGWGFASECAAAIVGTGIAFASAAGPAHPLPSSRSWELEVLPSAESIHSAALNLLGMA